MLGMEDVYSNMEEELSDEDFMGQLGPSTLGKKILPSCDELQIVHDYRKMVRTVTIDGIPISGVVHAEKVPMQGTDLIGVNLIVMAKSFYQAIGQLDSEDVEET